MARIQPRFPGIIRKAASTSLHPDLEKAIKREMKFWNVSRAFVLANCAAFLLGVDLYKQQDYRKPTKVKTRNRRVR